MSDAVARLNAALEGRYAIERELGEGGMATVYLAKDLKHNRNVALKVLKPELAAMVGAERFLTEIETTANLQHPHVLPLFDSGEADSFLFYVMPYVEGETLGDRIGREKQLPVDEAVALAVKVAGALHHAHEHGVIHRDIKPGNILIQGGEPVVADFGIALAVGSAGGSRLTETGLSVGTPYYMSPEQATGDQTVGPASDTYALACVLYEMLVGEAPYLGNTAQAVLGKIIAGEPVSATKQRATVPANVDAALRCALEKLPADRFTSTHDFAKALADPSFRHGELAATASAGGAWRSRAILGWGVAAALAIFSISTFAGPEPTLRVGRFAIAAEDGTPFTGFANILPDGSGMMYVAPGASGETMLWIRRWNETTGTPIRGTEGASDVRPSVSPDGLEVAFSAGFPGPLRIAPLLGGSVRTIADLAYGGGVWTADGETLYFCDGDIGISSVSPGGGEATQLLVQPDSNYVPLSLLEGDEVLLVRHYAAAAPAQSHVQALRLETGEVTTLVEGSSPATVTPSGQLVFATVDGAVMGAPFDAGALAVTGAPALMIEGLATNPQLHTASTLSRDGSLLYLPGTSAAELTPVWVERGGRVSIIDPNWRFAGAVVNSSLALSPDGRFLAVVLVDGTADLWIKELDEGPRSRFTFEGTTNRRPSWSEDGETVFFLSNSAGQVLAGGAQEALWSRPADGSRAPELVLDAAQTFNEAFLAPGGEWLIFRVGTNTTSAGSGDSDIYATPFGVDTALPVEVDTTETVLVNSDFQDWQPAISPDGRWLAYVSDESGQMEVYVRPFPDAQTARAQVSIDGGTEPLWSPDGRELFYRGTTQYVAASVVIEPTFSVRDRRDLFPVGQFMAGAGHLMYDVHPDGDRFVMLLQGATVPTALVLVQNFFEELKGLVPN